LPGKCFYKKNTRSYLECKPFPSQESYTIEALIEKGWADKPSIRHDLGKMTIKTAGDSKIRIYCLISGMYDYRFRPEVGADVDEVSSSSPRDSCTLTNQALYHV
jgi:hypothetical protein